MNQRSKKVFFLLGMLTLAGLVFLLSREPQVISTTHFLSPAGKKQPAFLPEPTPFDQEKLLLDLKNYLETRSGTWGLAITRLNSDQTPGGEAIFGLNQDRSFAAASVMKLLVAANLINRADQNEFSLEKDLEGNTLAELMQRMINRTDNDAWYQLNDFLGFNNLQVFAERLGMANSSVYKNTLSPTDVNLLLIAIYHHRVAGANLTQLLMRMMVDTETENRIPAGVDEKTTVYHKSGTWLETGTYADAGIIAVADPFVLTVLSEDVSSRDQGEETIRTLTRMVFDSLSPASVDSP